MKSFFKFLSRNKAYTAINVLGLAVALMFILIIGAYTWQETYIDTWHSKADRTYLLGVKFGEGPLYYGINWRVQHRLRDRFPEIETSCGVTYQGNRRMVTRPDGENLTAKILYVDSTFYDVFDFRLSQGDKATALVAPNSAVISEAYARSLFGDEDPIGKSLKLEKDSVPVIVTAVMEPMKNTMLIGDDKEPIDMLVRFERVGILNIGKVDRGMNAIMGAAVFFVATPDYDLRQKNKEIEDYLRTFFPIFMEEEYATSSEIVRLDEIHLSDGEGDYLTLGDKPMVKLLFAMGMAILLFAVINYINLTVTQSTRRAKEMATRRLMGDSRMGIVWRLIAESTLVVLFSFFIGLGLAAVAMPYFARLLNVALSLSVLQNPITLVVGLVMLSLTGVSAGIIPAIVISRAKPIDVVRGTFRRTSRAVLSKVFIVLQNAVTVIMLVATFTIYLQLRHLVDAPLGFEYKDRISLWLPGDMKRQLGEAVKNLSCVDKVVYSLGNPINGGYNNSPLWEGNRYPVQIMWGSPDFLDFYGLEVLRDDGGDGYFVNEKFLNDLSLPLDATEIPFGVQGETVTPVRGVLKNFRLRNVLDEPHPIAIQIMEKMDYPWSVDIKIRGDQAEALKQISEVFRSISNGPELIEFAPMPFMEQWIQKRFEREGRIVKIVGIFALVAVIISMLGLVAMSTYYVQQRAREIAVRKVFGSTSGSVLQRLLKSFMTYVAVAIVIAVPVAWWLMSDWLSEYSYRIPLYWWIFAAAGAVCVVISLLSVWLQSWRAASANPVKALYQN